MMPDEIVNGEYEVAQEQVEPQTEEPKDASNASDSIASDYVEETPKKKNGSKASKSN